MEVEDEEEVGLSVPSTGVVLEDDQAFNKRSHCVLKMGRYW